LSRNLYLPVYRLASITVYNSEEYYQKTSITSNSKNKKKTLKM